MSKTATSIRQTHTQLLLYNTLFNLEWTLKPYPRYFSFEKIIFTLFCLCPWANILCGEPIDRLREWTDTVLKCTDKSWRSEQGSNLRRFKAGLTPEGNALTNNWATSSFKIALFDMDATINSFFLSSEIFSYSYFF